MIDLSNKNIIITGASSGIGRQIAVEASNLGATIVLVARREVKLRETFASLKKGNHLIFSLDITDFTKLEPIITESVQKLEKISGFVHAAGIEMTVPFRNMNPEYYQKLFNLNVISGFELARIISKKNHISKTGGSFVFIGSIMSKLGKEGVVGYSASKAALTSSVKSMALELAAKKIRCNLVLPGLVNTEMMKEINSSLPKSSFQEIIKAYPLGLGEPEDIASLILFLLSDKSKWITGSEFIIDGGYSAK